MTHESQPIAIRAAAPAQLPEITAGDLAWRAPTIDDAAAIAVLENTAFEHDGLPYRDTPEDVVEELSAPGIELSTDALVGLDLDGRIVATGSVLMPPGDDTIVRAFASGIVHPARRGEGIGGQLLAWQVARARQRLASSGKELPARIGVYLDDAEPASKSRMLERAGFTPKRFYADLARRFDGTPVPEVTLSGGLRLVPFDASLDDAARLAHNDAFRDHWGSQPQTRAQWQQHRTHFAPAWSFLVVDDTPDVEALLARDDTDPSTRAALEAGEPLVVGYALASRYETDFAPRGYTFGYTDLLGARRAYRGRKAAMAALAASLAAFEADGMDAAVLDVDTANPSGAHGMYAALGYRQERGSRMLTIEL